MILTDAGPLVAIIDRGEARHDECVACLAELTGPLLTTWPAFTEAMYLLGEAGGWTAQRALWRLIESGDLEVAPPTAEQTARTRFLMEKYRDRPMDLADASLVALAEERRLKEIFTLDHTHFATYRLHRNQGFRVIP